MLLLLQTIDVPPSSLKNPWLYVNTATSLCICSFMFLFVFICACTPMQIGSGFLSALGVRLWMGFVDDEIFFIESMSSV